MANFFSTGKPLPDVFLFNAPSGLAANSMVKKTPLPVVIEVLEATKTQLLCQQGGNGTEAGAWRAIASLCQKVLTTSFAARCRGSTLVAPDPSKSAEATW